MKKILTIQIVLLCVLGILFLGYIRKPVPEKLTFSIASSTSLRMEEPKSQASSLLNPLVIADIDRHYIINFKPLKFQLVALQKKQPQKTFIYFAYLNNSSWIGLNEKDFFTAASTVKVPLAMAIYKMEEQGKLKFDDSYSLIELDLDSDFGQLYKVGADNEFTLEELVAIMLTHSDNTALRALFHVMELHGVKDPLADVYAAMGWDYNDFGTKVTYIDINMKTLSNMFMSLYNAVYLSTTDSQKILRYLSQSDFNDQIVSGVPKDMLISHKIGVNEKDKTYSDCGIVYAPARPYIICVGSVGAPKKDADSFMKSVSRTVYEYVINN